jgi:hypothetical protein
VAPAAIQRGRHAAQNLIRAAVILQWAWSYLTFERGARLITETAEQVRPREPQPAAPAGERVTQSGRLARGPVPRA